MKFPSKFSGLRRMEGRRSKLFLKDEKLPADEVDQHVGDDKSDQGQQRRPVKKGDEGGLSEKSPGGSGQVDQRKEGEFFERLVSPLGEDPFGVQPVNEGIGEDERDESGGERGLGPRPTVDACIVEFWPDFQQQELKHHGVDNQRSGPADAILDKLNERVGVA